MITSVVIAERALKDLRKLPRHIVVKLQDWVEDVEERGLETVRKTPGYHDEPLHGHLIGLRSIRLSRSYRAVYKTVDATVRFVSVERIHKHDY